VGSIKFVATNVFISNIEISIMLCINHEKLVDSDLYKTFLKIIHLEWLVGQKFQKSFGSFEIVDQGVKTYMINCAFYGSEFYKELIPDEVTQQQYIVLK
jgi:hypothetical protein